MEKSLSQPAFALDLNDSYVALATFTSSKSNSITIHDHDFKVVNQINDLKYPPTNLRFNPNSKNLFATTSEFLRLYNIDGTLVHKFRNYRRVNNETQELCAPLTAFDWCLYDTNNIITCSLDTTCTVWDLELQKAKVQLIAHDKEIHDVKYGPDSNTFGTVSSDGSLRQFDLRQLQHSTILYESRNGEPLLRFSWNKMDGNLLSTFHRDTLVVLDVRVPAVPVYELKSHNANVCQVEWHHRDSNILLSGADDGQIMMWDINKPRGVISAPRSSFGVGEPVSNFKIFQDLVAICTDSKFFLINC